MFVDEDVLESWKPRIDKLQDERLRHTEKVVHGHPSELKIACESRGT